MTPTLEFVVAIPARYAASRLPGKPLRLLGGEPLVLHVARRALDAGVCGYLLKDSPAEQLADAIRKVERGIRAIDPQLAIDAWSEADPLNDRERQILRLAGDGLSAGDIATLLNLSAGTVRNYLSEAIGKLGAGNRIEAFRIARQKGWL